LLNNQEVPFYALTGTLWGRSILDMHKLMALALGPINMPLPQTPRECKTWASAVDEKVMIRSRPGALEKFLESGEPPSVTNIRKGLGRRIFETPGVVASETVEVGASLCINMLKWPVPPECDAAVEKLLDEEIAPNGDPCTASDIARHLRSMVLGFYYSWDPSPPWAWLDARRHWKRFVADILTAGDSRYDTELQVWNGCDRRDLPTDRWEIWNAVKSTYYGESVPTWLSDDTVDRIVKQVGQSSTLVWVEQVATGEYLSEITGWPYFHKQGRDAGGKFIDDHDPQDGPALASIASNHEGRNLQHWDKALVVSPPANGKVWEQLLGRMHRPGQLADTVTVDVLIQHPRIRAQFRQAIRDARMHTDIADQPRKLLLADYTEAV
jgi:hypothetical protein